MIKLPFSHAHEKTIISSQLSPSIATRNSLQGLPFFSSFEILLHWCFHLNPMLKTLKIFLMASQGWPQKALHGSLSAGGAFDSTLTASNFQRSNRAFIYQPQMLQYNQYLWGKNVQILVFQNKHHFDLKLSGSAIWTTSNRRIKHVFSRSFGTKPPCQENWAGNKLLQNCSTNHYQLMKTKFSFYLFKPFSKQALLIFNHFCRI